MSTATVSPARTGLRRPALERDAGERLAGEAYERFAALLGDLRHDEWSTPTECPGWDVRAMAGHVLGMARMVTSLPSLLGQNARATLAGGGIDALTGLQVRDQAELSTAELVERTAAIGPVAVRGRLRLARTLGALPLPERQVVGDARERWSFAFLFDVVLTRDTWMHRMDVCRATGRAPELTADHDGVLVDDVVREWLARHGRPVRLHLTGPAGGTWEAGDRSAAPELELDAVEFCRLASGRGRGAGLLAQQVPF